jgi:proline iminopeptidase
MVSQIAPNLQTSMVEVKTGLSLYTVELGNPDGAPMLILHGGWGPADNQEHRLDILSEEIRSKFRIIYFHQRGWGWSKIEEVTGTDTSTGIDANIADCEVLRQHFGIDKWAVVYGCSNGAALGLAYAAKYFGSTVSGLVLCGLWLIREQDLDHDYGDGKNGKGKYYPAQWRQFIGHVGYKTRADLERLEKTENPGLELVNKYWELMTGGSPEKSRKAAVSWLKWDNLGATVDFDNTNPPGTSIELLTSDQDIVKLGLTFYKSLNSHASAINSKNFLDTVVAKINGDGERVIESREELVRSLWKKIRLITGEFDMLCPPAFAHEVIEKLLESEADTDERTESESFALKKTCQIVKGASHTQYDPGMPDAIQKAMLEIAFGEQ